MRASNATRGMRVLGMVLGLGITAILGAQAQDARISSKPWLPMTKLEKTDDFKRLPDDAQIAMACAKCKSVIVSTKRELATKLGRGTAEQLITVDSCPGCGGKMVARADKQTEWVHTCSQCGDHSAFCCATKKDAPPAK